MSGPLSATTGPVSGILEFALQLLLVALHDGDAHLARGENELLPRLPRGARRNSQSPFAAANLSSFPPGPALRSRPPEPESSPEEE